MNGTEDTFQPKEKEPQPGNILAVHFKLYGGDGVSLQSQELHKVLRQKEWNIFECCSDLPANKQGLLLPEISYQTTEVKALKDKIFTSCASEDEDHLLMQLTTEAQEIRDKVEAYLDQNKIRIIHVHNIFSVPFNPAATLAFFNLARDRQDIHFVAQHHDLINEGRQSVFQTSPNSKIAALINEAVLPDLPNIQHVTLSHNAAEQMNKEKGIKATVVPDGFDFEMDVRKYSQADNFRERFNISEDDLIIGVMTRVVPRKAIEFAIQLAKSLHDKRGEIEDAKDGIGPHGRKFNSRSRIVLLLAQKEDTQDNIEYSKQLMEYAKQMGVEIIDAGRHVTSDALVDSSSSDSYPFYSIYSHLDVLGYPTTQEGFGNQLLEGVVLARKLVPVMFEYPVYKEEIAPFVPNIISLGDKYDILSPDSQLKLLSKEITAKATEKIIYYLLHPEIASEKAEQNYYSAKAQYDIRSVARRFTELY